MFAYFLIVSIVEFWEIFMYSRSESESLSYKDFPPLYSHLLIVFEDFSHRRSF